MLRRDNLPAVDVKTWYLHAHMFDGDVAAGPVPLLFAANPDVAAASIAAEPAKAHFDLSKVTYYLLFIYFIYLLLFGYAKRFTHKKF
jgi:hypothetical protein